MGRRTTQKQLDRSMKMPFLARNGQIRPTQQPSTGQRGYDAGASNGFVQRAVNSSDTADIDLWGSDPDLNSAMWNGGIQHGYRGVSFAYNSIPNAELGNQVFFIAPHPMTIMGIQYSHSVACATAGAVTAYVEKLPSGIASGSGIPIMTNTFNTKATANVRQAGTLPDANSTGTANFSAIDLAQGDRLGIVFSNATLTSLAGVTVTISYAPGAKYQLAQLILGANGEIASQAFFLANQGYTIASAWATWSVAGSDPGTVSLDITQETTTGAPASGTTVLSAAVSLKGTANVPTSLALTATAANLVVLTGNRLSFKLTGTPTALAGLVVIVAMTPATPLLQVTYNMKANGNLGDSLVFICPPNRTYDLVVAQEVHSTAGTDGGAVTGNWTIERDSTTTAPGGGTSAMTSTFNLKGTANTVQTDTMTTTFFNRLIGPGDRLSFNTTGNLTTLAGVLASVTLRPVD